MGVDFKNGCYVSYNFYDIFCGDYGMYAYLPCSKVIQILTIILDILTLCDYWPMTEEDIKTRESVGANWYWGHGDKIISKSEEYIKGQYYHMSYADIISVHLEEARKCGRSNCKCWSGDSPRQYDHPLQSVREIKAAVILQRKFYWVYVHPRKLKRQYDETMNKDKDLKTK